MSHSKRDYDSTVARIAGNILSGFVGAMANVHDPDVPSDEEFAVKAVALARIIVAETRKSDAGSGDV